MTGPFTQRAVTVAVVAKTFRPYAASLFTRTKDPMNDARLELFALRFRSSADGRDAASDGR
jgi:hypothetical protein